MMPLNADQLREQHRRNQWGEIPLEDTGAIEAPEGENDLEPYLGDDEMGIVPARILHDLENEPDALFDDELPAPDPTNWPNWELSRHR